MALYQVVRNQPSQAQDLNQIVNLLNGTDTATPITVSNRITAQMAGATPASAYVGGANWGPPFGAGTFAVGDMSIDPDYGMPWTCYQASGGPLPQGAWQSSGAGGLVARWWQTNTQTLNSAAFTTITLDTASFDPWSMWSSSVAGYVIPQFGWYAFCGSIHPYSGTASNYRVSVCIFQNNQEAARGYDGQVSGNSGGGDVDALLWCNAGDLIQLVSYISASGVRTNNRPNLNSLAIHYIGAQLQ
ncbi:hypothetical protein ABT186_02200 [Streptomyces sp. NPDC001634]|uniref:hypothetical protein n=1 Tax=Streptomyces sp. NPDC001634 TaxID=3154390 RepID=UPI00331B2FD1